VGSMPYKKMHKLSTSKMKQAWQVKGLLGLIQ